MDLFAEQSVSFTGRCLALSRTDAEAIVVREGGRVCRHVTETTDLLVVGSMGWPLQRSGRLTRKLDDARRLQRAGARLIVQREEDFLRRLGEHAHFEIQPAVHRYTLAEMSSLVSVPPQRLLYWISVGLVTPLEQKDEVAFFSFNDVARCSALCQLSSAGVNGKRLVRALRQLQIWLPETAAILDRLSPDGRTLSVRDNEGRRIEPNGQFLMDFGDEERGSVSYLADFDSLFDEAVDRESVGDFGEAEEIYRRLLERDNSDIDVLYNLANVLVEQKRFDEALPFYHEAIYLDPEFVEAWNNLGSVLSELGRSREALLAYERACQLDPQYPSSLFGLAKSFEECGRLREARQLWSEFLEQQSEGPCADFARARLRS